MGFNSGFKGLNAVIYWRYNRNYRNYVIYRYYNIIYKFYHFKQVTSTFLESFHFLSFYGSLKAINSR